MTLPFRRKRSKASQNLGPAPRVLILSASAGAGHLRAAEALEVASKAHFPQAEVTNLDTFQLISRPLRKLYGEGYLNLVTHAAPIVGHLYDLTDKPVEKDDLRVRIERAAAGRLRRKVRELNPALVICTHFLPASLLMHEVREHGLDTKVVTVVTDFDVHGLWVAPRTHHYFVANNDAHVLLCSQGVTSEAVTVTGIPTHPSFAEEKDRSTLAAKYGLDADLPTMLFSAGGFGVGPIEDVLRALLKVDTQCQLILACGRNQELLGKAKSIIANTDSKVKTVAIGFTKAMDELMSISNLMIGKPGGLTSSESFVKGLGWIIINPIPGQEERNSDMILEHGAGIRCRNLGTLAYRAEQILGDRRRLRQLQSNAWDLSAPDAAAKILKTSKALIGY